MNSTLVSPSNCIHLKIPEIVTASKIMLLHKCIYIYEVFFHSHELKINGESKDKKYIWLLGKFNLGHVPR